MKCLFASILALLLLAVPARAQVGINLATITDASSQAALGDIARTLRAWNSATAGAWVPDPNVRLDGNGYPLNDSAALAFLYGYPAGDYAVTYTTTGTVTFRVGGNVVPQVGLATVGGVSTCKIALNPPVMRQQIGTPFTVTVTGGGLSDLHILAPGFTGTNGPWRTEYVNALKPFGCVRLMCVQRINEQTDQPLNWADRPKLTDSMWTSVRGIPPEALPSLLNAVGRDGWVCVPDTATDDYLAGLAKCFATQLNAGLNLYTENSNELWNTGFPQFGRNASAADANAVILDAPDRWSRVKQWIAYKGKQAGDAFKAAFTAAGKDPSRVRPVLCGQAADSSWASTGLDYVGRHYGAPANSFYAVGLAPYMNLYDGVGTVNTLDDLFAQLDTENTSHAFAWITTYQQLAQQYGLKMVGYECGQGLIPGADGTLYSKIAQAAQDDPRMAGEYQRFAAAWSNAGGALWNQFCDYSPRGSSGCWGMLEYADSTLGVKSQAVLALAAGNAPASVPTTSPVAAGPTTAPTTKPSAADLTTWKRVNRYFETQSGMN